MVPHAIRVASLGAALAFAALASAGIGSAVAQEAAPPPAEAPRCGGLLCDLGVIGGPSSATSLPCNDFLCRAFGGGHRAAAAAPPPASAAVEAPVLRKPDRKARKKRLAKRVTKTTPESK